MFSQKAIAETPTTNPKTLIGRNVEVSLGDLTGQYGRDYYRLVFRVDGVDGKSVTTRFNGYSTLKEHIMRVVRKRSQKIEVVSDVQTRDSWKLQATSVAVLNRNTESAVQTKVRHFIADEMKKLAEASTIDNFVRQVTSGGLQRDIKKRGCKIYPVRFFEIARIEVMKAPAS
jgi:small subunit ribosomal protein S3Ae